MAPIPDGLSFAEQAAKADEQLATNRANCAGMDEVGAGVADLLTKCSSASDSSCKVVCADQFDADCSEASDDSAALLDAVILLTETSSVSLEDDSIAASAANIVTQEHKINHQLNKRVLSKSLVLMLPCVSRYPASQ